MMRPGKSSHLPILLSFPFSLLRASSPSFSSFSFLVFFYISLVLSLSFSLANPPAEGRDAPQNMDYHPKIWP